MAEMQVTAFTGLEPPNDVPVVRAVRRAEWIAENLEGLRSLLEPSAAKLGEAVAKAQGAQMPEGAPEGAIQMLRQLSPLLLGAQVGSVLGALAQQVLGQYDVAVPRPAGAGALLFVVPNIAAFEKDWSLDPTEFRTWIAVHEVTHRFEFSRPWALPRFRELLEDFLSTLELDVEGLQRRFETLDPSNPEAMQELFAGEEGLFGTVLDAEQRLKLGRIQAFMAAAEGYGDHVMHGVGRALLPDVRTHRGGHAPLPRDRAGRPGVRAAPRHRDEARAVPAGKDVLRHRGRAHRRGHARADVGLGRGDALAARDRRASPVARAHRLRRRERTSARVAAPERVGYPSGPMAKGELVFANAVDRRIWDAQGERGPAGIYLAGAPGRALPFTLYRAWKVVNGLVTEEIRFIDPSGRTVHRWGPEVRRMRGTMDLTVETDVIEDAVFQATGTHLVSFIDRRGDRRRDRGARLRAAGADEARQGDRGRPEEVRRDLGRAGARRRASRGPGLVRLQERQDLRALPARAGAPGADPAGPAVGRTSSS